MVASRELLGGVEICGGKLFDAIATREVYTKIKYIRVGAGLGSGDVQQTDPSYEAPYSHNGRLTRTTCKMVTTYM